MSKHYDPPILTKSNGLRYKFVELSIVTDDTIERTVNEWVAKGWILDGIRFVTTESSRRPAMAFISFVREDSEPVDGGGAAPVSPYGGGKTGPH
ncbi:MAG: hypothetical protein MJE77_07410 [Proteobacteria bacterium]|nr:hypothetical protein [Pseudomonadota bacterium]